VDGLLRFPRLSAALTRRHFDISRQTFYRWRRRHNRHYLSPWRTGQCSLAGGANRRPRPNWWRLCSGCGKNIPVGVRTGLWCSSERGAGLSPLQALSAPRGACQGPQPCVSPEEYPVEESGGSVQADTLDVRPVPRIALKQFTGCDVDLLLGRPLHLQPGLLSLRLPVSGRVGGALSLPRPGHLGGRWLGVQGPVRGGAPAPWHPPPLAAAPFPQAQRARGAGPPYSQRGVLGSGRPLLVGEGNQRPSCRGGSTFTTPSDRAKPWSIAYPSNSSYTYNDEAEECR
jgi:hypothetical protein